MAEDLRLHGEQVAEAIDDRTGLVVGSAPCYPYGVIDHVTEHRRRGGRAGRALPRRRLPRRLAAAVVGAPRRARAALGPAGPGRDLAVGRRAQVRLRAQGRLDRALRRDGTSTGTSSSSTTTGPAGSTARPPRPGPEAGCPSREAWAAVRHLGADGYLRLAEVVRDATRGFQAGHRRRSTGSRSPATPTCRSSSSARRRSTSVVSATSWTTGAGTSTASRAASTSWSRPATPPVVDRFVADLADAVATHEASRGREATYGGTV